MLMTSHTRRCVPTKHVCAMHLYLPTAAEPRAPAQPKFQTMIVSTSSIYTRMLDTLIEYPFAIHIHTHQFRHIKIQDVFEHIKTHGHGHMYYIRSRNEPRKRQETYNRRDDGE